MKGDVIYAGLSLIQTALGFLQLIAFISDCGAIIKVIVTVIGKTYPAVGACGLDCALCLRYYTKGKSKCDGCGSAYSYAAVGCKIFRCCVKEKALRPVPNAAIFLAQNLKEQTSTTLL